MPRGSRSLSALDAIEAALRDGRVLLGLDFDGTMAPIVDHPDDARPLPGMIEVISGLAARPRVQVALVSGRTRDDLIARAGYAEGVVYVGEHGNDFGDGTPEADISEAVRFIGDLAHQLGAVSEVKRSSVTLHTRGVDDQVASQAENQIRTFMSDHPDLQLLKGKMVFEVTAATATKGDAIDTLARGMDTTVYFGDDVTDETVFARLHEEDVGVKVGEGETKARFRLPDPRAVLDVLERAALASR